MNRKLINRPLNRGNSNGEFLFDFNLLRAYIVPKSRVISTVLRRFFVIDSPDRFNQREKESAFYGR